MPIAAEKLPLEFVRTVGPTTDPSQWSWIHSRWGKSCPVTESCPLGTAEPETLSDAEAAPADSVGMMRTGTRRRIGRVAIQSRKRR
jgi:hypothetical protein